MTKTKIKIIQGECLEKMDKLIRRRIKFDAIITDPPYGIIASTWDSVIPLNKMWERLKKLRKDRAAIILFGTEPFSSYLRMSNIKEYKYDWLWVKERGVGFQNAKHRPMMKTEIISIFGKGAVNYYPIMTKYDKPLKYRYPTVKSDSNPLTYYNEKTVIREDKYPVNLIPINTERGLHPTQKPVALVEYLIKTYTKKEQFVLDFTMGSGTTGIACMNTKRNFIGIELNKDYFELAKNRLIDRQKHIDFNLNKKSTIVKEKR